MKGNYLRMGLLPVYLSNHEDTEHDQVFKVPRQLPDFKCHFHRLMVAPLKAQVIGSDIFH